MAAILVTGGTGKTGAYVAKRLARRGVQARVASRSSADVAGQEGCYFDWHEPESYAAALDGIKAVYLVAPQDTTGSLQAMLPFLEQARLTGVVRFVLLSSSALAEGGPLMGGVHAWLRAYVPEWTVLRPTWFMQNFSEAQHHLTIRDEGKIYTATGNGRIPFVHADDIAAAAVEALLASEAYNRDFLLTGPETLSYSEVAEVIAAAAGRSVSHVNLSEVDLTRHLSPFVGPDYAATLARMDGTTAQGSEDRLSSSVAALTGNKPQSFGRFAAEHALLWAKPV